MDKCRMKEAACAEIDRSREEILKIGETILHTPELGFREEKTAAFVRSQFEALGFSDFTYPACTGIKAWARGAKSRASVAVIGELDAVPCKDHPFADPLTKAAHACGHNMQIASLLGCAMALVRTGIMRELDGDVCFLATPAEEYVELEYRLGLQESGKIGWLGGKQELISEGAFDDVDMAMMTHAETNAPNARVVVDGPAVGFIGKKVSFLGREAHAGGAPWEGINALNAAALAVSAIHFQRETFRDEDHVRVHPILTHAGDAVNVVPARVTMESYVRAGSVEAMSDANAKVNRAVRGASRAIGAKVEIHDMPGYLPLLQNKGMSSLFAENACSLLGEACVESGLLFAGSTDMGDLGSVLPVIQPTVSGFSGALHSRDFKAEDVEMACLVPAKLLAMTVIDLLRDDAKKALAISASFPRKSAQEYARLWNSALKRKTAGRRE